MGTGYIRGMLFHRKDRRRPFGIVFVLLGQVACLTTQAEILPSLPEDDPTAPFLERMDGLGSCRLPDRRPWPGEAVLACLSGLDSTPLPAMDRTQVAQLRKRLSLRDSFPAGWGTRPAWETRHGDRTDRLLLDLGAEGHFLSSSDSSGDVSGILGGRLRPKVEVLLGDGVALWSRPSQLTEISDRARWVKEMDPGTGVYQTALFAKPGEAGKARTVDGVEGGLEAELVGVRVRSGMLRTSWGPLPEPMMFSGETAPFPLTEASTRIGPIEAVVLAGRLTGDSFREKRYVYGHRIRWVGTNWSAAWSEAAISVGRDLEPLYMVPVFPIIFTEHQLGDPDNRQMDFDLAWRPRHDLELSSELFLDDLQNLLGFFSNGWGNKWALGLGLRARDFTGPRTLDRFQVARIEPWTGGSSSSVLPGQERNLPVHFGKPLGSDLGPNSLSFLWDRRQDLSERWSWLATARASWKGTDPGSSIDDLNWADSAGTWIVPHPTKTWLGEGYYTRQILSTGAEARFAGQWRSRTEIGIESSDQYGKRDFWPVFSWKVAFRE